MSDDPGLDTAYWERLFDSMPKPPRFPKSLFFAEYGTRIWVETVGIILAAVLALSALLGVFIGGALFLDQRSCASEAHGLGLGHQWGPLEGCLLRSPGGQYIPDGQYFINHPQSLGKGA
jgi:hypothetical protein